MRAIRTDPDDLLWARQLGRVCGRRRLDHERPTGPVGLRQVLTVAVAVEAGREQEGGISLVDPIVSIVRT